MRCSSTRTTRRSANRCGLCTNGSSPASVRRPTLIERDDRLPPFGELLAERERAHQALGSGDGAGRLMRVGSGMSLASFEDAFAHALFAAPGAADAAVADLVAQPAFAVYRNTVTKSCIDALQANFPTVTRLVGEEWFRAAAAAYVARERPNTPSLQAYGATFAAFLADFAPAAELPYLADVARLDRFWIESHGAVDAPVLDAAGLVGTDPGVLAGAVLLPHPAVRWAWFAESPVYSIWRDNRARETTGGDLPWHGEGALLTRRADVVEWTANRPRRVPLPR